VGFPVGVLTIRKAAARPLQPSGLESAEVGAPSETVGPIAAWMDRLVKLVPAEVLSIFPVGNSLIAEDFARSWWALACLFLTFAIRAKATWSKDKGPQWAAVFIACAAFAIWIYVLGSHFPAITLAKNLYYLPSILVLVWTTIIPIFYQGE